MGLYATYVLPRVINMACSLKPTMKQRAKVVPLARGRVLEIGIGSGLNLPYYDSRRVSRLWGLDPSIELWSLARARTENVSFELEFLNASAEDIPLQNDSADTVVITYTLCSVPDALTVLSEVRRVLAPGGELVFCEHGAAPDERVRWWQDRLNPLWKKVGGGCNLNRNIFGLLSTSGFDLRTTEAMYIPGWRPASYNYWGVAT